MPETLLVHSPPRLRGPGGRPLRIAHLTTVDLSLAVLLRTELEVDVASGLRTFGISAPGAYVDRIAALGVEHVPLSSLTRAWDPRRDLRAVSELAAAVRRLQLDVLHTHNPKTGVIGRMVGRLTGVPVVVNTCHGLWATVSDPWSRRVPVYIAEGVAAAFSHAELYQNATDRQTLRRWISGRKCEVVGNGTDLTAFTPDPAARLRVRRELGVEDRQLLVGGVGRLVAEKGVREFAATARRLADRAVFVWAGPSDPEKPDSLRPDEAAVRWVGERSDMPAFLNALDVFVLPSYREGFSRSAMEAAACGLPMVLSDIRGCREIGRHGQEILLVPAGDNDSLVAAVEALLGDPALRHDLGSKARSRALACFDQRKVAATSLRTYVRVAEQRGLGWTVGSES